MASPDCRRTGRLAGAGWGRGLGLTNRSGVAGGTYPFRRTYSCWETTLGAPIEPGLYVDTRARSRHDDGWTGVARGRAPSGGRAATVVGGRAAVWASATEARATRATSAVRRGMGGP
jgi:hypothetical protein